MNGTWNADVLTSTEKNTIEAKFASQTFSITESKKLLQRIRMKEYDMSAFIDLLISAVRSQLNVLIYVAYVILCEQFGISSKGKRKKFE